MIPGLPPRRRVAPVLGIVALALACDAVTVQAPLVVSVALAPRTLTMAIGESQQVQAIVRDEQGNALSAQGLSWTSSDPAVVAVTSSGLVSGLSAGVSTVTAQVGAVRDSVTVTVSQSGGFTVDSTEVTFSAEAGGATSGPKGIAVEAAGAVAAGGLSISIQYGAGQPSGWLTATLSRNTTPALLTLSAQGGTLPVGQYSAAVSISAAGFATTVVTVNLSVRGVAGQLVADRSQVAIQASQGGSVPSAEVISLSNSVAGALTGLTATVDYGSGATGWLTTRLSSTLTPATLTLNANQAGLSLGTHRAEVQVSSPDATNSPITVEVTLSVVLAGGAPRISLEADSVGFDWSVGSSVPAPQALLVSNGGGGTLSGLRLSVSYAPGQPSGWLVAALGATTAPTPMTLTVTPGSLGAGTYEASVEVVSGAANNSPQFVQVLFNVTSGPLIDVTPDSVGFDAVQGGGNPATQTVTIDNPGTGALTGITTSVAYGPGQPTGWLSATLSGTAAPASLDLAATTGSLPGGTHTATVMVASPVASNSPRAVEVTFTVLTPAPSIVLNPTNVAFQAATGGSNPATRTVAVTNGGGLPLTGLAVGTVAYSGGASGWLAASIAPSTAPASLTLAPDIAGLAEGTYSATVPVTSPVAPTRTVSVTLVVEDPPAIVLSRSILTLSAVQGGTNPPDSTIDITNGGTAALTGLAATVNYAGTPGWLSLSLSGSSAPTSLVVATDVGGLTAGTYNATIEVTSAVPGVAPASVAVAFTVAPPPPAISLSPTSLTFAQTANTGVPSGQAVAVTNSGGQTLTGLTASLVPSAPWLSVTLNGTTAPTTVDVSPNTSALAPGTYGATLQVAAPGAANSPQDVAITYTVQTPPTIALSTGAVAFTAQQSTGNPAPQTVAVTNTGAAPLAPLTGLQATVGAGAPWLSASLNTSTAPATLTLTAATGSLTAGTYNASVSISSSAPGVTNSPQTVAVTFAVTPPPPSIGLNPSSLSFATARNTGLPSVQSVAITNTGGSTLSGLQASVSYGTGSGWLGNVSLSGTTAPATLRVQPSTDALSAGTYNATVSITGTGATNNPQTVAVRYVVTDPPSIALSATSRSFSAVQTGPNPPNRTVRVTNGGGGTLSGLSVSTGGLPSWLSASISSSTAPATVTLSVNSSGLSPNTYSATVPVAASGPGVTNSPQNISVSLVVTPQPTIVINTGSVLIAAAQGQSGSATVQITELNGNPMPGIQLATNYTSGSTGWLSTSLSSSGAPSTLTLTASAAGLALGSHTADVLIDAPGATNSANVQVTLDVQPGPSIGASDLSPTISGVSAGGAAVTDSISILNAGGGTLTGLATGGINYGGGATGWLTKALTATSATTTTPAYLRLTVNPTALTAGQTYTATFQLTSPVANNSPQTVRVTVIPN